MNTKTDTLLSRQWITIGAISGIMANLLYPLLLTVSLPSFLEILFAGMFGILLSLSGFAIHHLMKYDKPTVYTQIGAVFILISGFIFNIMLVIQLTFNGYLNHYKSLVSEQHDLELLRWIQKSVSSIHLGLDVSADFYIGLATILFSVTMFKNRFFGAFWSISGLIIAVVLLGIKFYAFPMTPYEIGFPYIFGPITALWYLAVCVQCLRNKKHLTL